MSFDIEAFALRGTIPDANHGRGGFCPRRTVLDNLLVKSAVEAGAELLAQALTAWFAGDGAFDELMAQHESARNERVRPMYEFTTHLAALEPAPPEMQALFAAVRHNQDATNAFLSAITGVIPLADFMSSENIGRIMATASQVELHEQSLS